MLKIIFYFIMNLFSWGLVYGNSLIIFLAIVQSAVSMPVLITMGLLLGIQFGCAMYVNKSFLEIVVEKIYG